jgi:hypothetical protein
MVFNSTLTIFQLYPGENHWPVASQWQTLSHNVVSSTPRHEQDSNSQLLMIGTDCTGSYNSMRSRPRRPLYYLGRILYTYKNLSTFPRIPFEKLNNSNYMFCDFICRDGFQRNIWVLKTLNFQKKFSS